MDEEANRVDFPKIYRDKARALFDTLFSQKFQRKFVFYREKALWPVACTVAVLGVGFYGTRHVLESFPIYHNYAIQKSYEDREAPPTIHKRESKICGSFVGWISSASPAKIKTLQDCNLNCVNLSFGNLSTFCNKQSVPLYSVFVRHFHVKHNPVKNSTSLKSRIQNWHNRNNGNEKESTFFSIFIKASSTTAFVFAAFALSDVWKSLNNFVREKLQPYLLSPENRIVFSDMFVPTLLIVGTNIALFMLWQVPAWRSGMMKWAMVSKDAGVTQMLLAAFSHSNLLHIFMNMYVYLSFVKAWEHYSILHQHNMPQDLMSADKFMAFYLSAGVVASAGSYLVQNIGKLPHRSLGASGAILGLIGYITYKIPDGKLSIAFLPQFSFSGKSCVIGIAMFDTAGLLLGALTKWKYTIFDHAAHLSGLLFGLWYASSGEATLYRWADYARRKRSEIFGKR